MYCIQPTFKSPIHLALTDVAEVCRGSRQLIKIMNRLGVVMSSDVHDHFVTKIAEEERQKKVWDSLNPTIFTIASADNFDLLKSCAAVFCGDQYRSFHGTTIQLVQPDPALQLRTFNAIEHQCTSLPPRGPHKRLVSQSPGSSPHQLGKKGPKRRRTVTPMSPLVKFTRPHSEKQMSQFLEDLSVEQFKESEREAAENDSISVQIFIYLSHTNPPLHPTTILLRR